MRGLPAPPPDVYQLTQWWEATGLELSTSWWIKLSPPFPLNESGFAAFLSDYTLYALPNLLQSQSSGIHPTTCRLAGVGLKYETKNPPASGAWGTIAPVNTAGGLRWETQFPARRSWALTYLPGIPNSFVEGGWQLAAVGWANLQDSAVNFWETLQALPGIPPGTVTLGTLHRQELGVPLAASEFAEFAAVVPSGKVVTIRRRIPAGRRTLPF